MSGRLRVRVISRAQKVGGGANIREVKCGMGGKEEEGAISKGPLLPSYLLQFS